MPDRRTHALSTLILAAATAPVAFAEPKAALVTAGVLGGFDDPEPAIRVCASSAPFLGLLGIAATGFLALRIAGPITGLVAAALLAVIPYVW